RKLRSPLPRKRSVGRSKPLNSCAVLRERSWERPSNMSLRQAIRSLVYPGLDLHTRNRAALCRFWETGPRDVLDAGSGNGYFAWLAYKSGGRVVAMNFEEAQVQKAKEFLLDYRKADPARLQFEQFNLYNL